MCTLTKKSAVFFNLAVIFAASLFLSGCTWFNGSTEEGMDTTPVAENQPYYPKEFREILIPDGLIFNRENSMFIKSDTFNGGILSFQGRLEVNSLSDFFETSMQKEGWKFAGSVNSQKSLLIFTKAGKSCMITIVDTNFALNTEVNIYVTAEKDAGTSSHVAPSFPAGEIIQ